MEIRMTDPIEALQTFTECDLKVGKELALGDHSEFLAKLIINEEYEKAEAMKRAYKNYGKKLPNIR